MISVFLVDSFCFSAYSHSDDLALILINDRVSSLGYQEIHYYVYTYICNYPIVPQLIDSNLTVNNQYSILITFYQLATTKYTYIPLGNAFIILHHPSSSPEKSVISNNSVALCKCGNESVSHSKKRFSSFAFGFKVFWVIVFHFSLKIRFWPQKMFRKKMLSHQQISRGLQDDMRALFFCIDFNYIAWWFHHKATTSKESYYWKTVCKNLVLCNFQHCRYTNRS